MDNSTRSTEEKNLTEALELARDKGYLQDRFSKVYIDALVTSGLIWEADGVVDVTPLGGFILYQLEIKEY